MAGRLHKSSRDPLERAEALFRRNRGILRTQEAVRLGIHPRTLQDLHRSGVVERLSRGLYRLAVLPPLAEPDLVTVALRAPRGVICLVSALAFHELTTQIPHEVCLAIARGAEPPRIDHPPVRIFWFSGRAFTAGVETHAVDGVPVRVYSAAKTVADCFKYRNKLGIDTATEALRLYLRKRRRSLDELMQHARVCRVERVMRPYLEAQL
ncbi:MAG: transcriptional regulator [Planctomycetes bacterium]|nr:transcriptional regulator [Planctomycetota bacterium]